MRLSTDALGGALVASEVKTTVAFDVVQQVFKLGFTSETLMLSEFLLP